MIQDKEQSDLNEKLWLHWTATHADHKTINDYLKDNIKETNSPPVDETEKEVANSWQRLQFAIGKGFKS